jgi:uncharacterized membrane-anchored protein
MDRFELFFSVVTQAQTYRNGLYLLLTFPLGLAYGCFLLVGWFLGYGLISAAWSSVSQAPDLLSSIKILAILVGGTLVWILVVATCGIPAWLEKRLAHWLLNVDFLPSQYLITETRTIRARIWDYLSDPVTWKCVVFITLKLPLGIALFTFIVGLISAATGLLLAPLAHLVGYKSFIIGPWRIDTWGETFLAALIGVFALPLSLHLLNGIAYVCRWFAIIMLDGSRKAV